MIKLICETCGCTFERNKSEVNRNIAKGRKIYCSLSCFGKNSSNHLKKYKEVNTENIKKYCNNKADCFSPFRWYFNVSKKHAQKNNREFSITLIDLKNQWELQDGKCPLTGWNMKTMINTKYSNQLEMTPDRASLDRIDSSKGYTKDNIRFISLIAQYAKNKWSDNDVKNFCKSVINFSKN